MNEEMKKEWQGHDCPECNKFGMHYDMHKWKHCGRFRFIRAIIVILVILFAFWIGVKIGEVKGIYGNDGYGYRYQMMYPGMMGGYWQGQSDGYYNRGPWMMNGWYNQYPTSTQK